MRFTNAALICRAIENLRATQIGLGHTKPTDKIEFNFVDTFACGNEEANVGSIVTTMAGHQITTDGVFTYRVNEAGQLIALRAFWEVERAAKTARKL